MARASGGWRVISSSVISSDIPFMVGIIRRVARPIPNKSHPGPWPITRSPGPPEISPRTVGESSRRDALHGAGVLLPFQRRGSAARTLQLRPRPTPGRAEGRPIDGRELTRGLFEVHVCKGPKHKPPASAYVAVRYRSYWYYIDDADQASKTTLALMV
jgi:hypothetical protein